MPKTEYTEPLHTQLSELVNYSANEVKNLENKLAISRAVAADMYLIIAPTLSKRRLAELQEEFEQDADFFDNLFDDGADFDDIMPFAAAAYKGNRYLKSGKHLYNTESLINRINEFGLVQRIKDIKRSMLEHEMDGTYDDISIATENRHIFNTFEGVLSYHSAFRVKHGDNPLLNKHMPAFEFEGQIYFSGGVGHLYELAEDRFGELPFFEKIFFDR